MGRIIWGGLDAKRKDFKYLFGLLGPILQIETDYVTTCFRILLISS